MMGQVYNRVFTQLARDYKFIIRDNGLDIQLRVKAISVILLIDWLDERMLSQNLNLLDH